MKYISCLLLLFSFTANTIAQSKEDKYPEGFIPPEYIGYKSPDWFLRNNFHYPKKAFDSCIQGRVVIGYTIDTNGSIVDVHVKNSVHPLLDETAMNIIMLPGFRWKPAYDLGKPAKIFMTMPFIFVIENCEIKKEEKEEE